MAGFAFAGAHVRVRGVRPETLRWLKQACLPSFQQTRNIAGPTVEIVYEDVSPAPQNTVLRPCFALDQTVIRLPSSSQFGASVSYDQARNCTYTVDSAQVRIATPGDDVRYRLGLLRVLRTLLTPRHGLFLHASGLVIDGRAVLFCGPKGRGKTTLLAYMLHHRMGQPLANDCVLLHANSALGVPGPLCFRDETVDRFPELRTMRRARHGSQYTIEARQRALPENTRLTLSMGAFADAFDTEASPGCPIGAVIWLDQDAPPGLSQTWVSEGTLQQGLHGMTRRGPLLFDALIQDVAPSHALGEAFPNGPMFQLSPSPDQLDDGTLARRIRDVL